MTEILCVDCKHSFRPWYDIVFGGSKQYSMRCRLALKTNEVDENLVTGSKPKPDHYETCSLSRLSSNACGKEGKLWQPKDPKKLFFYMKRV